MFLTILTQIQYDKRLFCAFKCFITKQQVKVTENLYNDYFQWLILITRQHFLKHLKSQCTKMYWQVHGEVRCFELWAISYDSLCWVISFDEDYGKVTWAFRSPNKTDPKSSPKSLSYLIEKVWSSKRSSDLKTPPHLFQLMLWFRSILFRQKTDDA